MRPDREVIFLVVDPELLIDGPTKAKTMITLAHRAGAPMDSPFLDYFAKGLGERGYRVVRFEYPYMATKRVTGKAKPPDREPVLRETWLTVVEQFGPTDHIIDGKSMGGRIASLVADEAGVSASDQCLGKWFGPEAECPWRFRKTP
jgi:predicted alpha/beta-hydrolase family hydrolase